jgi:hypothetical protein
MIVKTQKVIKVSSLRLNISGVQRKGIVVGKMKIICCQLHQMSTEQDMPPQEAWNFSGFSTRKISGEAVQQANVFIQVTVFRQDL